MKISFNTNAKAFEKANFLIQLAIESLESNLPRAKKQFDFSETDLKKVKVFRRQLVKGFINSNKKQ